MSDTIEVLMPLMGEGITEATLVKWLKKPGDTVKEEEPLLEVSTDKVDTEIPCPASGRLEKVLAEEGAAIQVNAVIAIISAAGKSKKESPAKKSPPPQPKYAEPSFSQGATSYPRPTPGAFTFTKSSGIRSSPLVRKIAREYSIDLANLKGSGLSGRITKFDIESYIAGGRHKDGGHPGSHIGPGHEKSSGETLARVQTTKVNGEEFLDGVPVRREKMSKMRQLIAEHMVRSVRTSPHVTTVFEIDMDKIVKLRDQYKDTFLKQEEFKLTYTPFIIEATVQAIKRHPLLNVSLDGDDILYKDEINVGCAVALDNGLLVPVIKNAGELRLVDIARRLNDLVARARSKKLQPFEVQGGTFSITNPGLWGSIVSYPIINQPQVAILGVGQIAIRPVVLGDKIGIRPLMLLSLTFDHRIIDGAGGAGFLATLKQILESYQTPPT